MFSSYPSLIHMLVLIGLFSTVLIRPVVAQNKISPGTLVLVQTVDENEFYGAIIEYNNEYVELESKVMGAVKIPHSVIKKIEEIKQDRIKGREYWSENPQSTRYFWAPNGYGLKKGEGYFQNVWVFFNQMSVGVADNMSIGIGLIPTFLFGAEATPVWVTPKASFPVSPEKDAVHIGLGALFGTALGADNSDFGILYGVTTIGSKDTNMNFGIGLGYAERDWASKPTLTFSAMIRTGKRGYFITENYLMDWGNGSGFGIVSFGGRIVGKRLSFDYGLMVPVDNGDVNFAIPWIGVAVPMGD